MLEQLISLTNSESYIQQGHILMKEVVVKQKLYELKMTFDIYNNVTDVMEYHCEVICKDIAYTTSNRLHEFKRPFNRINVFKDHPLLFNYSSTQWLQIKGKDVNLAELMGELFIAHDYACGNWVDFHWLFHKIPKRLHSDKGATIEVPEELLSFYLPIFDKHHLDYFIKETNEVENNYLVLIFGNADISPDTYNFGQPYIVAKQITALMSAANTSLLQ